MIARLILICLSASLCVSAQQKTPDRPVVLPEVSYKRLLNDLQVIVASTPYLGESMTIGLVVRYGSTYDPADKGGLAYLLSRMFLKATLDKSAKDIESEMNYLGVTIETRCEWDAFRFILKGQSSRFERALLLLYQVVGEAALNDADFAAVKEQVLAQQGKIEDPRSFARSRFESTLFHGTTYGRPLQGTEASIKNITVGDVRLFYRRYFSSNAASLVVVGSSPAAAVLQKATRIWGVWVRRDDVPFTFLPPRTPASRTVVLENDASSPAAQFILGNLWARRDEPGYLAGSIAVRILQERLTKALPTSLVTVGAEGRRMPGFFYIQGQAAADQAVSEINKIIEVVASFKEAPVSPEEFSEAQRRWMEEYRKSLASTDAICELYLDAELYRLGTNYTANFLDLINRLTPDAVAEAATKWIFPGGFIIYVRGPAAVLKPALETLGTPQTTP